MKSVLDKHPQLVEIAELAMKRAGLTPECRSIRGGNGWLKTFIYGTSMPKYFCWRTRIPQQARMGKPAGYAQSDGNYCKYFCDLGGTGGIVEIFNISPKGSMEYDSTTKFSLHHNR